jgi:hypothetical protein
MIRRALISSIRSHKGLFFSVVVGGWGRIGADFYLLDLVRGRYDFDETVSYQRSVRVLASSHCYIGGSAGARRGRSRPLKTCDPGPYSHNRERVKGTSRPRLHSGLAIKERLHTETG